MTIPEAPLESLRELIAAGRYLDHVADTVLTDQAHAIARAHASAVWRAAYRLEALASILEEFARPETDRQIDRRALILRFGRTDRKH